MKRIVIFSLIPLLCFTNNFWNKNKVCYWQTTCNNTQDNKTQNRVNNENFDILVEKVIKQKDKFLNTLSAKKIKELLEQIKDVAITHPTERNLEAYAIVTNFIRNKSLEFMYAYTDFINSHPEFKPSIGTTSWSFRYLHIKKLHYIVDWLKKNNVGLYFVCDNSPACFEAVKSVNFLVKKGIPVVSISPNCNEKFPNCIEKHSNFFQKLGVGKIPAYLIFYKSKNGPMIELLDTGLVSSDRLIIELYRKAYYLKYKTWIDFSDIPLTNLK